MKVALVVRRLSTRGGTERVAHGFARWLVSAGHPVDVWCTGVDAPVDGVTVCSLEAGGRGVVWKAWRLAAGARRVPVEDYDVVLHLVRGGRDGVYRAGGGCHAAWAERSGGGLAHRFQTHIDRRSVEEARLVVANSELVTRELCERYDMDRSRLRLVRNGVDLDRFHPEGPAEAPSSGPAVAFLGADFERKGLATAIRAVARIDGLALWVVGDGPIHAHRRLASALGIEERVHFLGGHDRPERVLRAADALVLPTRYDPAANATLEAMSCGVPVVTTGDDGSSEILPEPWMVMDDAGDAEHCARVLQRVMDAPGLGTACRRVAENHGTDASYARLFAVLSEAAA